MNFLEQFFGGNQAQMPGQASQPTGLARLLQPEVALPMAAALMGQNGNMGNLSNAFGAAGPALQAQQAEYKKREQENKTLAFLKQNDPALAALVEGGAPMGEVWGAYMQKQTAQKAPDVETFFDDMGREVKKQWNGSEWVDVGGAKANNFRTASPEEAKAFGSEAGQFGPDGRFYPQDPPQGMTIESDGNGGFRMVQGSGKAFTEGQSKDNVFSTRARGALPTIDQYENELTSVGNSALDYDPTGLARGALQGADYQVAQAAGKEFLQAILRKDSGGAITPDEQVLYGGTYLPKPGDGPEVIAYKRQARQRAVAAIESGMSPAQMVAQERALAASGGTAPPNSNPPAPGIRTTRTGVTWGR